MLHHSDPSQAEVLGFSHAQLEALTHSVEQRRQQLEKDIQDYIARKQDELRQYEQQVRQPFFGPRRQSLISVSPFAKNRQTDLGLAYRAEPVHGM